MGIRALPLIAALAGLVAVVLAMTNQQGAPRSTALAAAHSVSITDGGFSPSSITIAAGDTVTWTNNSSSPQTVNSLLSGTDPNFFASGFIYAGNSWSRTFVNAGTFSYKPPLQI